MNRNLLVFSLFIITAGLAFGLYIITFFGLLLLIPALASPSRPPAKNAPNQPAQSQPKPWGTVIQRRSTPSPPPPTPSPKIEPVTPPAPPISSMVSSYSTTSSPTNQPVSYTPALFPGPLIPSMSAMGAPPQPPKSPQEVKHEGIDELVEVGALLAVLKLVFC